MNPDLLMSILRGLGYGLQSAVQGAGQRMSGMMLPPEQRSIMPGVNEANSLQRAGRGQLPYVDPNLVRMLMGAGVTVPEQTVFHGSPSGVAGGLPTSEMGKVYGPQVGSPGHYVISSPGPASNYAEGSISEAGALTRSGDYAPNVRPYRMAQHQGLATDQPVTGDELQGLLDALKDWNPAPKTTKGGSTITPEVQRNNLVNAITSGMIPDVSPGEHLRGILTGMVGQPMGESLLSKGGFKSISYPGEHPSTMGMEQSQAYKVLDNSVLQNLFDYFAGKK